MFIQVEKSFAAPILHQVMDQIRIQCASGVLKEGERLPGIRSLARQLDIHRNTIFSAYGRLTAEGLLEMRQGDGAYVSASAAPPQIEPHRDEFRQEIQRLIRRSQQLGLDPGEFLDLLDEALAGQPEQDTPPPQEESLL